MAEGTQLLGTFLDIQQITAQVGASALRAFLNAKYPSEFEYYMCSFELMDSAGNLKEALIFPVMPNSIQENTTPLVNIKKTSSAIVSITNSTFVPSMITISGTFGRKIRLLLTPNKVSADSAAFGFSKNFGKNKDKQINGYVKTGYGVTKVLEKIFKMSKEEGNLLFFYNLAIGNNYLVEVTDFGFTQALENNMMWNYNFALKSLANAEDVYPRGEDAYKKSIVQMLKFENINKAIFATQKSLGDLNKSVFDALIKIN